MKLMYLEELVDVVEAVILANAKAERGCIGLLIVAPAGEGKTEVIDLFPGTLTVEKLSDISPWGVKRFAKDQAARKQSRRVKTILVPDFNVVLTQRNERTLSLMCAALAEGLQTSYTRNMMMKLKKPVRFGWVAACTPEYFVRGFDFMKALGFIDRCFIYVYNYTASQRSAINTKIWLERGRKEADTSPETARNGRDRTGHRMPQVRDSFIKGKTRLTPVRLPSSGNVSYTLQLLDLSPRQNANLVLFARAWKTLHRGVSLKKMFDSRWLHDSFAVQKCGSKNELFSVLKAEMVVK